MAFSLLQRDPERKSYRDFKQGKKGSLLAKLLVIALLVGAFYGGSEHGRMRWFDEGYSAGFLEGNQTGHVSGYETGFEDGRTHGWEYGWVFGKDQGFEEGYSEGENLGYDKGYDDGVETGQEEGYDEGYVEGFAETGWTIRDPTYSEMRAFLREDKTDREDYEEIYFDCDDFAATVKQNAFDHGYRCFLVYMEFTKGSGHAIVAFDTKDRGMIYVEPQSDEIMEVEIGEHYWNHNVSYDDTIVTLTLVP